MNNLAKTGQRQKRRNISLSDQYANIAKRLSKQGTVSDGVRIALDIASSAQSSTCEE